MSRLSKFVQSAKILAPILIGIYKPELAPIGTQIADAIAEAELIQGATALEKAAHVRVIAHNAAVAYNTAKGKEAISLVEVDGLSQSVITTIVAILNIVHPKVTTAPA